MLLRLSAPRIHFLILEASRHLCIQTLRKTVTLIRPAKTSYWESSSSLPLRRPLIGSAVTHIKRAYKKNAIAHVILSPAPYARVPTQRRTVLSTRVLQTWGVHFRILTLTLTLTLTLAHAHDRISIVSSEF